MQNINKHISELIELKEMDNKELSRIRNRKFRKCVFRQYQNDPFLRRFYNAHGIYENDLPFTIDDIQRLPIISRDFLEATHYEKNPILPQREILKNVHTYGSTATPRWVTYSKNATKRVWSDLFIRTMCFSGVDLSKLSYWITHYTPEKDEWSSHISVVALKNDYLGENAIDESTSTPLEEHLEKIKKIKPHLLASGPNFFLSLAAFIKGKDNLTIPKIMAGGQYFDEETRNYIENTFNSDMTGFYPTTENGILGSEDVEKRGYHIWSDEHEFEIVDKNGENVSENEIGEAIVTTFSMDGSSIIRYSLGDTVRYKGESSYSAKFPLINTIRRVGMAPIGDGRIPYAHIEDIGIKLRKFGIPLIAHQLTKRREKDMRETPILRLELKSNVDITKQAVELLLENDQIRYLYEAGEIHYPMVETYGPGELTKGSFKLPLYSEK